MKAMILAAGRGERMGTITRTTPKPLLTAGRYCLIEYHLLRLQAARIKEIVINVHHLAEKIIGFLGDGSRYDVKITYSYEPILLDIGGGIFNALPLLGDEPFIIISADTWSNYCLENLSHSLLGLGHLVLVDNPPFHPLGDFSLNNRAIGEPYCSISLQGSNKLNYAGIAILSPKLFTDFQPGIFSFIDVIKQAILSNKITGEYYQGPWFNIGTPDCLADLNNFLNNSKGSNSL